MLLRAQGGARMKITEVVMIGNLSEEERAELDAQCDIWQAEAIDAQESELMEADSERPERSFINFTFPKNKVVSRWLSVGYGPGAPLPGA